MLCYYSLIPSFPGSSPSINNYFSLIKSLISQLVLHYKYSLISPSAETVLHFPYIIELHLFPLKISMIIFNCHISYYLNKKAMDPP